MERLHAEVADMILERGAFKFGAFKLKLHEKNPDAPLSPFYIDLRTADNPTKPGLLTVSDCDLIAQCLWEVILKSGLTFQAIAGIPYAGDPIVEAIERIVPSPRGFRVIKLAKFEKDGKRKIVPLSGFEYRPSEVVLLIDDLVTKADSKNEAIDAIESQGSVVRDLVVLLDRQQGGKEGLAQSGRNLVAAFAVRELLEYYKITGQITVEKFRECMKYIQSS